MSYGFNLGGHGDEPPGVSCWYGPAKGDTKSASYVGSLEEIAVKAVMFIRQCQAEEAAASAPETAPEAAEPTQAEEDAPAPAEEA